MPVSVSLKLDHRAIQRKIDRALENSPVVRRLAYKRAYGIFLGAKRAMLREFDRHIITQEIEAGPNAVNMSGTLDGYGNLFSFIGFYDGSNPTEQLRNLLDSATDFRQTVCRNRAWYFRVTLPTQDAIAKASPMPWEEGNSWAFAVESYISGLSHYLYKRWAGSRSGMGAQLPYEYLEDITFSGRPYISEILRSFRERIGKHASSVR